MSKKKLFSKPYGYKEAFAFVGIFPLLGFFVEFFTGAQRVKIPQAPYNIYILLGIALFTVFSHLFLTKKYFFKWISSIPVSIATITYISILVLIMSLTPQNQNISTKWASALGFNYMAHNWAILITALFLLYNLGLVILRRLKNKFTKKNIVFLLNHIGLWIVIAAGTLGSGDLTRLTIYVMENKPPEWRAQDENGQWYELPIAIKLIDFNIDEFNPEIALVNNHTGDIIIDKKNKVQMIEQGKSYKLEKMTIHIDTFYKNAMRVEGKYVEFLGEGAASAVKISIFNNDNIKIAQGWISNATYMQSPQLLKLNENFSVGLLQPAPERYSSQVLLFSKDGTKTQKNIEVNKPVKFKGWKIYQVSYDEDKGAWSELSILELVRDPWLPVVYIGIFMILLGSIYLFWIGKNEKL